MGAFRCRSHSRIVRTPCPRALPPQPSGQVSTGRFLSQGSCNAFHPDRVLYLSTLRTNGGLPLAKPFAQAFLLWLGVPLLAGCGGGNHLSVTSTSNRRGNAPASTLTSKSPRSGQSTTLALNAPVLPPRDRYGGHPLLTCIPPHDPFLVVKMLAGPQTTTAAINIGHPLTTQGAGIKGHHLNFGASNKGWLTYYLPMGTVFDSTPNGELFAYFPPLKHHGTANTVWMLGYGAQGTIDVLTGGPVTANQLRRWSAGTQTALRQSQAYVERVALPAGWHLVENVPLQRSLTGYLGSNAWVSLPLHRPINYVNPNSMGNNIFEIVGVQSENHVPISSNELNRATCAASP